VKFAHFSHVWNKPGMTAADRYRELWGELELCDELGFDYAFAVEHHFRPHESWMPSPAAYCAAAAAHTKRLHIGPMGYLVPVYDPLRIVEEAAVLDNILDGRLELGLVSGILPEYFPPYSADYDNRAALTNEALAIIKTAFASDDPFSFEGQFHQYHDVQLNVRPIQKPHPPFWLESRTPSTLEMLGREGAHTGYTFFSYRPEVVPAYRGYLEHWAKAGHSFEPNISYWALVYVDETDELARERVRSHVRHTFTRVFHAREDDIKRAAERRRARGEEMGAEITFHLADSDYLIDHNLMFAGSPATVARNIRQAAEEGLFNTLLCELNFGALPPADLQRSIQLFGTEVLPALRDFSPY
jgi:alkanesulfonate monooxygenase SsuD/methylene tetrahydromethanopterin reductase-like flavin-dependent oxidoreductase (luciferase family)